MESEKSPLRDTVEHLADLTVRVSELERLVHELELVILELLPAPFERSERMVEFDRKRRAPDAG